MDGRLLALQGKVGKTITIAFMWQQGQEWWHHGLDRRWHERRWKIRDGNELCNLV